MPRTNVYYNVWAIFLSFKSSPVKLSVFDILLIHGFIANILHTKNMVQLINHVLVNSLNLSNCHQNTKKQLSTKKCPKVKKVNIYARPG